MSRLLPVVLLLALASRSAADCSPPGGIHVNEVRFIDAPSPMNDTGRLNPLVELFNKGATPVALGGWTVTDEARTVRATLPAVSLPAGALLVIHFATGTPPCFPTATTATRPLRRW
jgi:lamin tail-like protein